MDKVKSEKADSIKEQKRKIKSYDEMLFEYLEQEFKRESKE